MENVIYAHRCLWNLKFSTDAAKLQLYQYLMLIKGWRNDESHISPTASEQEVDTAISIIIQCISMLQESLSQIWKWRVMM